MSEIDDVDIELLIGEVKSHKEIWNIADENYHDRTKKRRAWISICQNFSNRLMKRTTKKEMIYVSIRNIIKIYQNLENAQIILWLQIY